MIAPLITSLRKSASLRRSATSLQQPILFPPRKLRFSSRPISASIAADFDSTFQERGVVGRSSVK
jgi:hypothetical protein